MSVLIMLPYFVEDRYQQNLRRNRIIKDNYATTDYSKSSLSILSLSPVTASHKTHPQLPSAFAM